ncbi:MAG: hypothetical protein SGPRY_011493 [Prymnesium sp.]
MDTRGREVRHKPSLPDADASHRTACGLERAALGATDDRRAKACGRRSAARAEREGEDGKQFVRFVLTKERMDTLGAVGELAELLDVPSRCFGFAGLKDNRAITSQRMSVKGVSPQALQAVSHPSLKISRARRASKQLKLGQLRGNRFRILIRQARGTGGPCQADAALTALGRAGFVNYYGLQRFGDCAARNDAVGRCLLLVDYMGAVDALLSGHAREGSSAEREARDVWQQLGDARVAHRLMPRSRTLEKELLKKLAWQAEGPASRSPKSSFPSHEERCRAAVLGLPLSVRKLLTHAYFSKVWRAIGKVPPA